MTIIMLKVNIIKGEYNITFYLAWLRLINIKESI